MTVRALWLREQGLAGLFCPERDERDLRNEATVTALGLVFWLALIQIVFLSEVWREPG